MRTPASCVEKTGLDIGKGLQSLNNRAIMEPNSPAQPEGGPAKDGGEAVPAEGRAASVAPEPTPPWAPAAQASGPPKIADKADDLEAIKKAVDDAAPVGGGLWLSYLFVLFYLAVAAGAVTHADLFFEKAVKLPFLGIELPLFAFFFLAPILFLVVHAYTLVHLVMLTDKAKRFHQALHDPERNVTDEARENLQWQLPSNIFVQFLAGPPKVRASLFGSLLRGIAWTTLVVAPVLLLLMMQIQFLPYHSRFVTWTLRVALAIDLALIWRLWWRRILSGREIDGGRRLAAWAWPPLGLALSLGVVFFSAKVATFPGEWQEELPSWRILPAKDEWGNPATEKDARGHPRKAFRDWVVNAQRVSLHDWLFNAAPDPITRRRLPFSSTLVLPGLNVYEGLGIDDPEKAKWHDFVFRARGRDLRGAIFYLVSLRKVDLTGAQLQGASLEFAQLQGASLDDAQLQGATLVEASLQGASLGQPPDTRARAELASDAARPRGWIASLRSQRLGRRLLVERLVQVEPLGVHRLDEREFRTAAGGLDLLLAGNGVDDAFVSLVPDERPAAVPLRECGAQSLAMLPNPPPKTRSHAAIERAVAPAGHDVNAGFSHCRTAKSQIARRYSDRARAGAQSTP